MIYECIFLMQYVYIMFFKVLMLLPKEYNYLKLSATICISSEYICYPKDRANTKLQAFYGYGIQPFKSRIVTKNIALRD